MSLSAETLQNLAQSAWLAGLAALLALALDRPLARRGRHGMRGVLWSLVLLRLVLPVNAALPAGLGRALVPAPLDDLLLQLATAATPAATTATTPAVSGGVAQQLPAGLAATLGGLWLAGTLALLLWAWAVTRSHRHQLAAARRRDLPRWWPAALAAASRRAGLSHPPTVLVSDAVPGAAALGVARPLIVLPPELLALGPRAVELVLLHEATHLRRHDTRLAALTWVVAAFWWWHPAAWLARRRLARLRELGCDAQVVDSLDGRRGDYGATLLAAADLARGRAPLPALVGASGEGLAERLAALVAGPRTTRRAPLLAVAAGLALLLGPGVDAAVPAQAPLTSAAPLTPAEPLTPAAPLAERAPAAETPASQPTRDAVADLLDAPGCLVRHFAAAALAARAPATTLTDGSPPSPRPDPR